MTAFQLSKRWLPKRGRSEFDATMAQLKVVVGDRNVSEFSELDGTRSDHLDVPAYFIAEWIAENWWPLLWEPRKSEDGADDPEFVSRHSLLAAQHGFALPRVTLVPTGKTIQITATARQADFADVKFRSSSQASPTREGVESELRTFVNAVCDRLDGTGLRGTLLQELWQSILEIAPEQEQFCRFAGALGSDPFDISDSVADLLDKLFEQLGERLLMDLCLVTTPATFEVIANTASSAFVNLSSAVASDISPLLSMGIPTDNFAVPAWRRGVQAAKQLRKRMQISDTDPAGSSRVFERLGIGTDRIGQNVSADAHLTGAVERSDGEARVALLQAQNTQRRFAAARALFSAWTSGQHETRFLTSAVTRDQQASRAFAAELTAPYALLRARAKNSRLAQDQVIDLASELEIGADVVSKQALNNGLQVRAY